MSKAQPQTDTSSLSRLYFRALGLLGNETHVAIFLALANFALAAAQFAEPILFGRIIDRMNIGETLHQSPGIRQLAPLIGAWIGFALFSIIGAVFVGLRADRMAHRRRLAAMGLYFEHVLNLPLSFHASVHSGRLLKGMLEGASALFWLWLSFFREKCADFVALTVLLPLALFINWRLGLPLIILVAIFGVIIIFVVRRTHILQTQVEGFNANLSERASDVLGNIAVIQSFTRIQSEALAMNGLIQAVLNAQMPVLSWWAVAVVAARAASTLTLLTIFIVGVWLHAQGLATIGQLVTFMALATMLIGKLVEIVNFINGLFLQAPKLAEFFRVLDTAPSVADRADAKDPSRLTGHVVFDHVTFAYVDGKTAIDNVSFDVAPGETVALVGATGSGKSTTLSLLHRVFDPQAGKISIDGTDIRDMTLAGLRRNIGVVFQEPMLFARSIEENVKIGNLDATNAQLDEALDLAQADEFVARQTEGLNTIVSERGRSLSGGERQRLAIARALLKDPPIMIFDEATSALDVETERQLQLAMARATKGRTTFIIAHRLATVRNADRIFVFERGKIVERGSYEDLVALGGRFAKLAETQNVLQTPESDFEAVSSHGARPDEGF
ncbi:MAG: glucan ABC transporter ATP-binding protein/ permease [Pseudomonadota bacterium]